ncbi:MAG TPA: hypothetical protein VD884_09680 [Ohtaekwangia sp.]|nr:hypothetical protein [Ohtaekwangia sp.]
MQSVYTPVWHKYRPVILRLMMSSGEESQQYNMSAHEFRALNAKEKGGYSFTLQASNGKAVNNIKTSIIAQNLLSILQDSPKANELMSTATYEFTMDKQFVLRVSKIS